MVLVAPGDATIVVCNWAWGAVGLGELLHLVCLAIFCNSALLWPHAVSSADDEFGASVKTVVSPVCH